MQLPTPEHYLARAAPARRRPEGAAPYGYTFVPDPDTAPTPWILKPDAFAEEKPVPPPVSPVSPAPPALVPDWALVLPVEDKHARVASAPRAQVCPRRPGPDALESHGRFELIDTRELVGGARRIVLHLPRRSRGFVLDPKVGDVIFANAARGTHAVGGPLDVQFVTRHKYFAPGRPVTSCVVGVPDHQWRRLFA